MYTSKLICNLAIIISSSSNPLFSRSHSQPDVDLSRPPELLPHHQVNISVPTGAAVRLHCTVTNVENQAVSWIRLSDYQILTNGLKTFTTDRRFSLLHSPGGSEWTLKIQSVKPRDQGGYQCQAATPSGVRTLSSWLWVNKPTASILGSREKHVNLGDSVTITCELRDNVGQPEFVFWYHNSSMINFQPGVTVSTSILGPDTESLWVAPPNTTVSKLTIEQTRQDHAGNYTCAPSNMLSDTIRLSISKDSGQTLHKREHSTTSEEIRLKAEGMPMLITSLVLMLTTSWT